MCGRSRFLYPSKSIHKLGTAIHTPLIPTLWRHGQVDFCVLKDILVYKNQVPGLVELKVRPCNKKKERKKERKKNPYITALQDF